MITDEYTSNWILYRIIMKLEVKVCLLIITIISILQTHGQSLEYGLWEKLGQVLVTLFPTWRISLQKFTTEISSPFVAHLKALFGMVYVLGIKAI